MEVSDEKEEEVDEVLEFITVMVILAVFAACLFYKWATGGAVSQTNECVETNQTMRASDSR